MAIFERDKGGATDGPGTVVGANVRLSGILKDTNDITIHGEVEGEVTSERNITVTESATIKGPITAENVVVAGAVHGAVTARDKLELLPSGKVYGAITMKDLEIRSGAVFIGKSTMPDERKGTLPSKTVPVAPKKAAAGTPEPAKKLPYELEE